MSKKNIIIIVFIIVTIVGGYLFFKNQNIVENEILEDDVNEISWNEAVKIIENCEAKMIFQSHALDIEINLEDGKRVRAKEPVIDEVFNIYNNVREKCGVIPIATE